MAVFAGCQVTVPLVSDAPQTPRLGGSRPSVRGRILAGSDPVENAYVYYHPGGHGQQHTAADGKYEVVLPAPGKYENCASPPTGRRSSPGEFMIEVNWNDVRSFDVQLGTCALSGIVRSDVTGDILVDVTVKATGEDCTGRELRAASRTDADGRFRFQPLRPGIYALQVAGRTYLSPVTEPIALNDGERLSAIDLLGSPSLAELRGDVSFGRREDLRDSLQLVLQGASGDVLRADLRDGSSMFEALQPGAYTLRMCRKPRNLEELDVPDCLVERSVELRAGETIAVLLSVPEDA